MKTLQQRMEYLTRDMPRGWQAKLARHVNISPPSIADWKNGKTDTVEWEHAKRAGEFFGVNPEWFRSGKGPQVEEQQPAKFASVDSGEHANHKHVANSGTGVYRIGSEKTRTLNLTLPQFDTGGSMGRGLILKDQPGVIHSWNVSEEWAHKNLPSNTGLKNLCIVTGFGPSMRPLFNPGDPLVCDRGVQLIDVDAIYFFRVGDEGYIKHIQRIPNDEGGVNYVVISENEKYKPWTITPKMDLEVFGKILKVWKGEEC